MSKDEVILGERFNIVFKVKNVNGDDFTIDSAQYDVEIDGEKYSGIPKIKDKEIQVFFSPEKAGIHTITHIHHRSRDTYGTLHQGGRRMRAPPVISSIAWSDNPATAGATLLISVTVTEGARLRWMDLLATKWNAFISKIWKD